MTRGRRLLGNFGIFAVGQLMAKLLSLVLVPVYTHYLPLNEFGQIDAVMTSVELLIPIFSLCLHEAVLRYVVDKANDPGEVVSSGVAAVVAISAVGLLTYPIVLSLVPAQGLVAFGYAILISQILNVVFAQYVRGIGRVKTFAAAGIIQTLVLGLSNIICLVVLDLGVNGYLLSQVISMVVPASFLLFAGGIWRVLRPRRVTWALVRSMLIFSVPLIPNGLLWWLVTASNRYFLISFHGLEANGLYAVANKLPLLVLLVTAVFNQAWQLSAYEEVSADDAAEFYSHILEHYQGALWVAASGLLVVVYPIVTLTFGSEYHDAWRFAPVLVAAVVFSSLSAFLGTSFTATKKTSILFTTTAIGGIVAVVLNALLVPRHGVWGASFSMAFGFFVLVVMRVRATRKSVEIRMRWGLLGVSLIVLTVQGLVLQADLSAWMKWPALIGLTLVMTVVHRRTAALVLGLVSGQLRRKA